MNFTRTPVFIKYFILAFNLLPLCSESVCVWLLLCGCAARDDVGSCMALRSQLFPAWLEVGHRHIALD